MHRCAASLAGSISRTLPLAGSAECTRLALELGLKLDLELGLELRLQLGLGLLAMLKARDIAICSAKFCRRSTV
jgi:hypothetical protein